MVRILHNLTNQLTAIELGAIIVAERKLGMKMNCKIVIVVTRRKLIQMVTQV